MCSPRMVNSIGLILDIIGVIMVWFYGVSGARHKNAFFTDDPEADKRVKRMVRIGLWLLIIGFGLQILSNWI